MADETTFEGWAILELMGHRRLAGYVRETTIAGAGFLRLDVPSNEANAGPDEAGMEATQFYPPSSVYCLTPTSEAAARAVAVRSRPEPVRRFELPAGDSNASCPTCGDRCVQVGGIGPCEPF